MTESRGDEYTKNGYVSYPGLLDAGELKTLLTEIGRISDGNTLASHDKTRLEMEPQQKPEGRLVRRIYEPCSHYAPFRDLSEAPRLLDAVESFLGPDILFHYSKINMKPPSIGSVVEGRVRKLTDFGAFLEIEDGVDGLVHVSDLSWTKHVKHPSELLKKGQMMQAVILSIDAPNRRLSLGVKQLQPDAWEGFFRSHEIGDLVRGRVCRAAAFGMFVELAPGVEALCHKSEIPAMPDKAGTGESTLPIGDEYDFKVIKMNETEKKIGLSLRAVAEDEERTRLEDYQRQAAAATMTIEEAMNIRGKGEGR